MSKSAIYAGNALAQEFVETGTTIDFGSIVRRYGCNTALSGGNVVVDGAGYYDVDTNVTFTADAVGTAVVQLYKDGLAIPEAKATVTTAATTTYAVSIPAIVRNTCGCMQSTISAVISGVAGTINNAAIEVQKI